GPEKQQKYIKKQKQQGFNEKGLITRKTQQKIMEIFKPKKPKKLNKNPKQKTKNVKTPNRHQTPHKKQPPQHIKQKNLICFTKNPKAHANP
ncbi:hypothetical protein ABFV62_28980, partial [Pseudomonas syringae]|uniref:hypothetical protein n=1 Tax=Pseudomonas syringae TaxID=317 RepID=UPI0034D79D2F